MSTGTAFAAAAPQRPCMRCAIQAPTRRVVFYQNIGMLFMRQTAHIDATLCRRCIGAYFRSFTLTTLFLGWWGMISFVITPFILLNNIARYVMSLGLAEPTLAATNMSSAAPKAAPIGASNRKFRLIYGTVVCVVLLGVAAYNNVALLEKYTPSLNAKLHSGEITESADAEYAGVRIGKDIVALSAPTKSQDWTGLRSELLLRQPYLNDLKARNAALQRVLAQEKSSNQNDPCEQLAMNDFGPALDSYTNVLDQFFATVNATTVPTKADADALNKIAGETDVAEKRLAASFDERRSRGCSK